MTTHSCNCCRIALSFAGFVDETPRHRTDALAVAVEQEARDV
jgi:hypothetical protein